MTVMDALLKQTRIVWDLATLHCQ